MTKVKGVLKKDGKELTALRKCVETQIGHSIRNSSDFAELSDSIQNKIREYVSVNTLKRIWNYINDGNVPSNSTLSILSRYVGFNDWDSFLTNLDRTATSQEFIGDGIRCDMLNEEDRVEVTWTPNRKIVIRYTGENGFVVEESVNSKLAVGDTFRCMCMFNQQPLFLDQLMHEGFDKPMSYICGKKGGVNVVLLPPPPQSRNWFVNFCKSINSDDDNEEQSV